MAALIFKPEKSAMQSGRRREKDWVLEFEPAGPRRADPLMGWWGSGNTQTQVRLSFDTLEEAIAYADRESIAYSVQPEHKRVLKLQAYADNFR